MEFFDEDRLITYSSLLPGPKDFFYLDGSLMLQAQELIYARNMAENQDLRASETLNSILSALIISRKKNSFRSAIRRAVIEERKKKGLIEYAPFRLYIENYQKLKDIMELIKEVAPMPEEKPGLILPAKKPSQAMEMSLAIDVVLILLEGEER